MLSRDMFKQIWLMAINDTEAFNLLIPYFKEQCPKCLDTGLDLGGKTSHVPKRCECQEERRSTVCDTGIFRTIAADGNSSTETRIYSRYDRWWIDNRAPLTVTD